MGQYSSLPSASVLFSFSDLGGGVVLLPPQPASSLIIEQVMQVIDGLIIVGGHDVDPRLYGQKKHPKTDTPNPLRDAWELALMRAAIVWDKPFLGICRGAQIMNVAFGGTLFQHLPEVVNHFGYQLGGGKFNQMEVKTVKGSIVNAIIGDEAQCAMYHHQAIDKPGESLKATAYTSEGIIQAIETSKMTFGLSVQWHPEETLEDRRLFEAFYEQAVLHSVKSASNHRSKSGIYGS